MCKGRDIIFISLVDSESHLVEQEETYRTIEFADMGLLFASMLDSKSPREYQKMALTIQTKLRENGIDEKNALHCYHPKWFGLNDDILVDDTICRFCGYKFSCEKFKSPKSDAVEIVYLDDSRLSKDLLETSFEGYDLAGNPTKLDPFMGFSNLAGNARKLYMISAKNFKKYSSKNYIPDKIETTVGYDAKYGQPIWSYDYIMLKNIHKKSILDSIKESLSETDFVDLQEIPDYDIERLSRYAIDRGWLNKNSSKQDIDSFLLIINRFAHVLLNQGLINKSIIDELTRTPIVEGTDFPSTNGCSNHITLVIRFLLFHSDLLLHYENSKNRLKDENIDKQSSIIRKMVLDELFGHASSSMDEDNFRFMPRFPLVAFSSEVDVETLDLEYPAGRVIDLKIADIPEPVFLIDGLGFSLDKKGPWSEC